MDDPSCLPQPAQGKHQEREFRQIGVQSVRSTWFEDFAVPKGPGPPTDQGSPNRCMALNWLSKKRRYR